MKLVVGLGNPGPKYETTRHNVGFLLVEELAHKSGMQWSGKKFDAFVAKGTIFNEDCLLIKPQTFMNLSGKSVQAFMSYFKILPEDIVVIHDDIDQEEGRVKAKVGGGHGGHNGIRHIMSLGVKEFHRIKIGVGKPAKQSEGDVSNWVLGPLSDGELLGLQQDVLDNVMTRLKGIFG